MGKLIKLVGIAGAVASALVAGPAVAGTVLQFEENPFSAPGVYNESGFTLTVNPKFGSINSILGNSQLPGNATRVLSFCSTNGGCTEGTSVTLTSSDVFSLLSLSASSYERSGRIGSLDFVGQSATGTVTQSLSIGDGWQSYDLAGFTNLTSLNISIRGIYAGSIDNLNLSQGVSAVPEPATWAMMLIGFGGIGGAMRSAKRRQVATVSYA